jgi:hypothetical protein
VFPGTSRDGADSGSVRRGGSPFTRAAELLPLRRRASDRLWCFRHRYDNSTSMCA